MAIEGFLLIDKPEDWTSFDVVAKTRNILKSAAGHKVKVGHTGTLDPIATGLLILVVGKYTKRSDEFMKLPKSYRVQADLSKSTDSHDREGEIVEEFNKGSDQSELDSFLSSQLGVIEQVPPQFSAIKIDGKRAYKSAREGKEVVIEPRPVEFNGYQIHSYEWPNIDMTIDVGSGFYVRSLLRDIGLTLEVGDMMTGLRRLTVGEYNVSDASKVEQLNKENILDHLKTLV